MSEPIKSSTSAATRRQEKTNSVDQAMVIDVDLDSAHSVNDEFGYPLWAKPTDQGNNGNTDGSVQATSTDKSGDDQEGN